MGFSPSMKREVMRGISSITAPMVMPRKRIFLMSSCAAHPISIPTTQTIIGKIVVFSTEGQKVLGPLREELSQNDNLVVTSSGARNIEINHVNAQKGVALQAYADSLNIPMDNVMAIGDNNNDVSMLKAAGISYAMGKGSDEVKLLAKHVTAPNTEDGAGIAIEEVLAKN